jgi:hypothetical protein
VSAKHKPFALKKRKMCRISVRIGRFIWQIFLTFAAQKVVKLYYRQLQESWIPSTSGLFWVWTIAIHEL